MAHRMRAILLANAIAASFFGLRASKLRSQGEALPEVDGALVGGASLKAEDFWAIAEAAG